MDADNHLMLERYFSGGMFSPINSPAEKINNRSKHVKFVEPQNFEKQLMEIYSASGTNNLPAIYNLVKENFSEMEMQLSHSENFKHIYCCVNGDYEIEGVQTHLLRPRPRVSLYNESENLNDWVSLAIFKRGTSTALFRI